MPMTTGEEVIDERIPVLRVPGTRRFVMRLPKNAIDPKVVQVTQGLREIFGRSPDAYGVTPLYIFRPIRIPAKEQAQ